MTVFKNAPFGKRTMGQTSLHGTVYTPASNVNGDMDAYQAAMHHDAMLSRKRQKKNGGRPKRGRIPSPRAIDELNELDNLAGVDDPAPWSQFYVPSDEECDPDVLRERLIELSVEEQLDAEERRWHRTIVPSKATQHNAALLASKRLKPHCAPGETVAFPSDKHNPADRDSPGPIWPVHDASREPYWAPGRAYSCFHHPTWGELASA